MMNDQNVVESIALGLAAPKRILFVDDNEDEVEIFRRLMVRHTVQLDTCRDGETGVKLALENYYYLVIVDLVMPGTISGLEVIRRIKHVKKAQGLRQRLAIFSGAYTPELLRDIQKLGAIPFFYKPDSMNLEIMEDFLGNFGIEPTGK